jgi:hypothetical protein
MLDSAGGDVEFLLITTCSYAGFCTKCVELEHSWTYPGIIYNSWPIFIKFGILQQIYLILYLFGAKSELY